MRLLPIVSSFLRSLAKLQGGLRVVVSATFFRPAYKVEVQSEMAGGDIKIKGWSRWR